MSEINSNPISSVLDVNPTLSSGVDQTSMGKDDFLKLMIAQMQNQDPLSPMENQEFSSQLAQFSSLEQLQNMNANIEQGVEINLVLTQAINNSMASTLIGKNAKAIGNSIEISDDHNQELAFNLSSNAEKVVLTIKDETGETVRTITETELDAGDNLLEWDRKNDDGNEVADGTYTFTVSAENANSVTIPAYTYIFGTIDTVRYENGLAILKINEQDVPFADVLEVGINDDQDQLTPQYASYR